MGYRNICFIITCIIMFNISWPCVHGSSYQSYNNITVVDSLYQSYNNINVVDSLDYYLYDYALENIRNPRAGKLYNLSLPANLTGVELSFARLRARRLWRNGANHTSYFSIPNWTLPWPFTKRVDLIYQNLGNWSTSYYDVPNHTFVAPILGFIAYEPNMTLQNRGPIDLKLKGENSIIVRFPYISARKDRKLMKCVRFDINGTFEFTDVATGNSCLVTKQGHFSIVVPNGGGEVIKRWVVIGVGIVVVGLLALVLIGVVCFEGYRRWIRGRRIRKMERFSEMSVALDTIWIGRSRMPFASGVRTYPLVESRYVPR